MFDTSTGYASSIYFGPISFIVGGTFFGFIKKWQSTLARKPPKDYPEKSKPHTSPGLLLRCDKAARNGGMKRSPIPTPNPKANVIMKPSGLKKYDETNTVVNKMAEPIQIVNNESIFCAHFTLIGVRKAAVEKANGTTSLNWLSEPSGSSWFWKKLVM